MVFSQKITFESVDTTLCLACSSSLPPIRSPASPFSKHSARADTFTTRCCSRPICPSCLSSNPRLARYNPCLRCLGGAEAVGKTSWGKPDERLTSMNVDGGMKDEDTFIVGDDDDDDEQGERILGSYHNYLPPPPSSVSPIQDSPTDCLGGSSTTERIGREEQNIVEVTNGLQYHIQLKDTLQGIALRFGVDVSFVGLSTGVGFLRFYCPKQGRDLCRLNKLPPSTLNTNPQLLHTRKVITLPPSSRAKLAS